MDENITEKISSESAKKIAELKDMGTIGQIVIEKRKSVVFSPGLINNRCSPLSDMGYISELRNYRGS